MGAYFDEFTGKEKISDTIYCSINCPKFFRFNVIDKEKNFRGFIVFKARFHQNLNPKIYFSKSNLL